MRKIALYDWSVLHRVQLSLKQKAEKPHVQSGDDFCVQHIHLQQYLVPAQSIQVF